MLLITVWPDFPYNARMYVASMDMDQNMTRANLIPSSRTILSQELPPMDPKDKIRRHARILVNIPRARNLDFHHRSQTPSLRQDD